MPEKRTKPRFGPLVVRAQIDAEGESHDCYLTNVSVGGAFLAIDVPPDIGTEIALKAVLPWNLGVLRARARVVWRKEADAADPNPDPKAAIAGVGLAFTELDSDAKGVLDAYLERFAELAARLD